MKTRRLHRLSTLGILTATFLALAGCSTGYSSLRGSSGDAYELIVADEQTILDAAAQAIQNRFPETAISSLAGREKGYTFYTQPFLDRTTYKFMIVKANGITASGQPVAGYYYSIHSYGTQFFVEQRYVEPLKSEFERILGQRGVALMRTPSVSFE
jgi:hypothetical protein